MAITPKPKAPKETNTVDVNALINRGGSPPTTPAFHEEPNSDEVKLVQLRLSLDMLEKIDASRSKRLVKIPRHTWILEALLEKLERESGE
jgi:hypothetical protein